MKSNWGVILSAGLLAGTMDILGAFIQYGILRGVPPVRILQSVASGLLGIDAFDTLWTAVPGLFLHFFIATAAASVYCVAARSWNVLVRHALPFGALYGIAVYGFMNLIVLPLSAFPRKLTYPADLLISGIAVHIVCVGLPIALVTSRRLRPALAFVLLILCIPSGTFAQDKASATFAGGCFWCMEEPFESIDGVISVTSGFTGGGAVVPTYKEVSSGKSGHVEAVRVVYDPSRVSYEQLLEVFWRNIDPADSGGQFCDRGRQYTSGIFYHGEQQKALAEKSKQEAAARMSRPVVTPVLPATEFYAAGEGHQDYYKRNAYQYKQYKMRCGRDRKLREIWTASRGAASTD